MSETLKGHSNQSRFPPHYAKWCVAFFIHSYGCYNMNGLYCITHKRTPREQDIKLVLTGWQLPTHVGQSFTHQMWIYQHKKVGEKVCKASSICCQQFAKLLGNCFCAVHTHQLELVDTSLPSLVLSCEGCFRCIFCWKTHWSDLNVKCVVFFAKNLIDQWTPSRDIDLSNHHTNYYKKNCE